MEAPSTSSPARPAAPQNGQQHHERRWLILGVIGLAQLMIVLDATIVNVALPSAQADLGFGTDLRQWIVTSYALAFGSLLLLSGRIGDIFGRKWTFIAGLLGFAVASAIGGAAPNFGVLVTARALQGLFAALLAPSALSLLATTFTEAKERAKAFAVFGAIAGGGGAVGLLLGGVLTSYVSWRWCLFVNLFFAIVAAVGGFLLLVNPPRGERPRLDIPGTVLATAGLFGIVFGFAQAEQRSWHSLVTIVSLVLGAAFMLGFVLLERRVSNPLLPLRVVWDRNRGGAYLAVGLSAIAIFGVFLFLTYYLQQVLGYSPVRSGVAFVPLPLCIVISSTVNNIKLLPRFGPRPLITTGLLLGASGLAWLTQLEPDSGYAAHVLPSLMLLGFGFGAIFAPAINTATTGVAFKDAGVASAMVNTMQQIGGSIGTALLSTIAAQSTVRYATGHGGQGGAAIAAASTHGFTVAFATSAIVCVASAAIVFGLIQDRSKLPNGGTGASAPAAAH